MTGMGRHLQANNPVVISAFHSHLTHQMLIVGVVLSVFLLGSSALRIMQLRRLLNSEGEAAAAAPSDPEPLARRILRVGSFKSAVSFAPPPAMLPLMTLTRR